MKTIIFFLVTIIVANTSLTAQKGVAINEAGVTADASAILDITSTNKGLLIPRMTAAQRSAIAKPATGLLVYQAGSFTDGFYYFNGNAWLLLNAPTSIDFKLPFNGFADLNNPLFSVTNGGPGNAIEGRVQNGNAGIYGGSSGLSGRAAFFENSNVLNADTAVTITHYGNGTGMGIHMNNASSTATALDIYAIGNGAGINILQTSPVTGGTGIQVVNAGSGSGVYAKTEKGNGVWGITNSISAAGVIGDNYYGEAVVGRSRGGDGVSAVVGRNDSSGFGVRGFNTHNGIGVLGQAGISGGTGVAGRFENVNMANTSNVLEIKNGNGAIGCGINVVTKSADVNHGAINANNSGTDGRGIIGRADYGVNSVGLWGISANGYAGYFSGKTVVQGDLTVTGTLSKAAGTFKIDHPLDPANKYLIHSFVESPDMMNVYNGNVKTGASGKAIINLPNYFEAENIDFKYQLTVVDENQFAQVRVSKKIVNNSFEIITDKPNIEISWQVTGVRNDAYAQKNRIVAEVNKTGEESGKYLYPELFNQPVSKSVYQRKELKEISHPKNTSIEKSSRAKLASEL